MRNEWIIARVGLFTAAGLACLTLAGCWSGKWDGTYPATFVQEGERTSITWISRAEVGHTLDPILPLPSDPQRSLLGTLAVAGVGLAIDVVKAKADERAQTVVQQWSAQNTNLNFWGDVNKSDAPLQGFCVRREADGFDDKQPAFELKVALVQVPHQPGLLALRPVSLTFRAARASSSTGQIKLDLTGELSTTTLSKGVAEVTSLGKYEVSIGHVAVPAGPNPSPIDLWSSGAYWLVFPAPPASSTESSAAVGGVLTVNLAVKESDLGKDKQVIETFSKFLGEQKGAITDYVKRRLPDNEQ